MTLLQELTDVVHQTISRDRLVAQLRSLSAVHRPPATPGFRDAAEYCIEQLAATALSPEVLSYPADGQTRFWTLDMPEEWQLQVGRLQEVLPQGGRRTLCDASRAPLSIAERSAPTAPGGITTELVTVDAAATVPRAGRLVLTSGDTRSAREQAVENGGASGVVAYDGAAQPGELQYHQWWWVGDEKRCPGFVISPEEGRRLEKALKHGPVPVHAEVAADFRSGSVEAVTALLPGTGPEEVLLIAHLDHPHPGANDNATGCAVVLESIRVLAELVREGALPRPDRGVRAYLTQEIIGTLPAVAKGMLDAVRAGLCLDMVSWRQGDEPGLSITKSAEAAGPYGNRLAQQVAQCLEQHVDVPISLEPFSSGSDHYVLCDATVGIPCPLLTRWPDDAWHTSRDVPDTLEEEPLATATLFAAAYAYTAATAGSAAVRAPSRLPAQGRRPANAIPEGPTVYTRRFRGPMMLRHLQPNMSEAERELYARMVRYRDDEGEGRHRGIDELIAVLNWTDGVRTVADTVALAEAELQREADVDGVVGFLQLLAAHGYLERTDHHRSGSDDR